MILGNYTDEKLRGMLFDIIRADREVRRKECIERCLARTDFPKDMLGNLSPGSPVVAAKSRIGAVLSQAISAGSICEDGAGYLVLTQEAELAPQKDAVEAFLLSLMKAGTTGKTKLFEKAEANFCKPGAPKREKNQLRSMAGQVLAELEQQGHIRHTTRGYCLADDRGYPNTELGGILREARSGGNLQKHFLNAIHTKGGEWFESYAVRLFREYFLHAGKTVDSGEVTGGSNDGGIDGIIHTTDFLGYRETILMQMKNRHAVMTAKDVREFYGAVCAENGSRGVFVTISSFHPEAQKLLDKVDNLTGVDGSKLFEMAKTCRMGLTETDGVFALDDKLFLET